MALDYTTHPSELVQEKAGVSLENHYFIRNHSAANEYSRYMITSKWRQKLASRNFEQQSLRIASNLHIEYH